MSTLPLEFRDGHLFIELSSELWVFDTGAPNSFGTSPNPTIAGEQFNLSTSYLGLDAELLSQFVGVTCAGLLGADVLGRFDHIVDIPRGALTMSTDELSHSGQTVPLDEFMGIPIVTARIGDQDYRMFFDTGAQVSYFQDDLLATFPPSGVVSDFYPGVGQFETDTFMVPFALGEEAFSLRCGQLPDLLDMTLQMASVKGIVGNAILRDRTVGYFPRRRMMAL